MLENVGGPQARLPIMQDPISIKNDRKIIDRNRFLPWLISTLGNRLSRTESQLAKLTYGLGVSDWRVICMLAEQPEISAKQIAQMTQMDKALVSRSMDKLMQLGIATVEVSSADGRRKTIRPTERALEIHDEIVALLMKQFNTVFDGFSESEIETFTDLLDRVSGNADDVNHSETSDD